MGKVGKWQVLSLILVICLGVSIGFNVYQYFSAFKVFDVSESSRAFVFLWPPNDQEIVDGTLRIEAVFSWKTENLSITVKVNDDDCYVSDILASDCLGVRFDSDKSGKIEGVADPSYVFFPTNYYYPPHVCAVSEFRIDWAELPPSPSPYHTCTFNNGTGYTFEISFPKGIINFQWPMLVHLGFQEAHIKGYKSVWVQIRLR